MFEYVLAYVKYSDMSIRSGAQKGQFGRRPNICDKNLIIDNCIPEPNSGCWIWQGKPNHSGYGRVSVNKKQIFAHRFSYEIFSEKRIPNGMIVCHKCDNPICVNPDHLYCGTIQDNSNDMVARGRSATGDKNTSRKNPHLQVRGSASWHAKLDEKQVLEIKKMLAAGWPQTEIAKKFPVKNRNINNINVGLSWNHVVLGEEHKKDIEEYKSKKPEPVKGSQRLQESDVIEIRKRLKNGEKAPRIAKDYGVSRDCIYRLLKPHAWRHIVVSSLDIVE